MIRRVPADSFRSRAELASPEYKVLRYTTDKCSRCGVLRSGLYLIDGMCQACANFDEPCVFESEPRGAFGLAGGWCAAHDKGWDWCFNNATGGDDCWCRGCQNDEPCRVALREDG